MNDNELYTVIIIVICITLYKIIKILGYYILRYNDVSLDNTKAYKFNINKKQDEIDENKEILNINLSKDMDDE